LRFLHPPERPFPGTATIVVLPVRDGRRRRAQPDSRPAHPPGRAWNPL